jgi:hypothetical protein
VEGSEEEEAAAIKVKPGMNADGFDRSCRERNNDQFGFVAYTSRRVRLPKWASHLESVIVLQK